MRLSLRFPKLKLEKGRMGGLCEISGGELDQVCRHILSLAAGLHNISCPSYSTLWTKQPTT